MPRTALLLLLPLFDGMLAVAAALLWPMFPAVPMVLFVLLTVLLRALLLGAGLRRNEVLLFRLPLATIRCGCGGWRCGCDAVDGCGVCCCCRCGCCACNWNGKNGK